MARHPRRLADRGYAHSRLARFSELVWCHSDRGAYDWGISLLSDCSSQPGCILRTFLRRSLACASVGVSGVDLGVCVFLRVRKLLALGNSLHDASISGHSQTISDMRVRGSANLCILPVSSI